jgi:hypothetical protein
MKLTGENRQTSRMESKAFKPANGPVFFFQKPVQLCRPQNQ